MCGTWLLTFRNEYDPWCLKRELEAEFLKEKLLTEHWKCHLCMLVIFTFQKLLVLLFHYSRGSKFGRECKMFRVIVVNPEHRIPLRGFGLNYKNILKYTITGKFLMIWTGFIQFMLFLIWMLFWAYLGSIQGKEFLVYTKINHLFCGEYIY